MGNTLLIDNYDSFTYNLAQLIEAASGIRPIVIRNDEMSWDDVRKLAFDRIVVSPGPGRPQCAEDLGVSAQAIAQSDIPVLGVCLGHQAIGLHFGATVGLAPEPVHGRTSFVSHGGDDLFAGIPSPFEATRYHSLAVTDLPDELMATAWAADGTLMALRHATRPVWGVQFHPESISTAHGEAILRNFFRLSAGYIGQRGDAGHEAPLRIHAQRCAGKLSPPEAYDALIGHAHDGFWLDSSRANNGNARFSYFGDTRGPRAEVVSYDLGSGFVTVTGRQSEARHAGDIFDYLTKQLRLRHQPPVEGAPFDFNGGYVGWFGYELKADLQGAAAHRGRTPDAAWIFADRVVVYDHQEEEYWLLCLDDAEQLCEENARWLEQARFVVSGMLRAPALGPTLCPPVRSTLSNLRWRHSNDEYLDMIRRSQELIRQGETYEVCLTNELTATLDADALPIYMKLRSANPVPFGAFLQVAGASVLCASPELYLQVGSDGRVMSKPIKGTAPRHADPEQDRAIAEELAGSVKNRSENLMIVDLLRNDLNRCCKGGTVRVPVLFGIESYATVHQLVSTIEGHVADGLGAIDCVRESFPGGSMTGAPKVRTMSILDELERGARGIYSGSIGYLSLDGSAKLNIVIRTIVMTGENVSIGAGGAIVALSDPEDELNEVMLKAQAQIRVLQAASGDSGHEATGIRTADHGTHAALAVN